MNLQEPNIVVGTIVAENYLAQARVLASSFKDHDPKGVMYVLLLDNPKYKQTADEKSLFHVLHLSDLNIAPQELLLMQLQYTILEFATAMKPWLLERILRDHDTALYLDPDIQVFSSLTSVVADIEDHELLVTPHILTPMENDGQLMDEKDLLHCGMYNLGFIGVGHHSQAFLEFWKTRLTLHCVVDKENAYFTDQRWVDFAPSLFDTAITKDPTLNVAYWNLHERHVARQANAFTINGKPLKFFHFSGYSPLRPHLLSKYQGNYPRIRFSDHPLVKELCEQYRERLLAHGYADAQNSQTTLPKFLANGVALEPFMQRSVLKLHSMLEEQHDSMTIGDVWNDIEAANALCMALVTPRPVNTETGAIVLSIYLRVIYDLRFDLQVIFNDVEGLHLGAFLEWTRGAVRRGEIDGKLIALTPKDAYHQHFRQNQRNDTYRIPHGIRISGLPQPELEIGAIGSLIQSSVEQAHIPFTIHNEADAPSHLEHLVGEGDRNVNIVTVNVDHLPAFAHRVGPSYFQKHYTIGVWAWELEELPELYRPAVNIVDEIWGMSNYTTTAIRTFVNGSKPVFNFSLPVILPKATSPFNREQYDIPVNVPMFLFCFDMLSVFRRTNPVGLIKAFCEAVPNNAGPVLVIKTMHGDKRIPNLEELYFAIADRTDIVIVNDYFTVNEMASLLEDCTCYVSLHRSEAFGKTMAEAMALGKPVIGTAYSGNLDFMTKHNSFLVDATRTVVGPDGLHYDSTFHWSQPSHDDAVRLIRYVLDQPEDAKAKGKLAQTHILEHNTIAASASFIESRYAHAQQVLRLRSSRRAGIRRRIRRIASVARLS